MKQAKILKPNILMMGLITGSAFGLFFGILMGLFTGSFQFAIKSTLITGGFFGYFISTFLKKINAKLVEIPEELKSENMIAMGPANHFKGIEGRGGWLYLTDSHLIFKSHQMNIQNESVSIAITDVARFGVRNTMGLVPNGLFVELKNGKIEKFVLSQRAEWIAELSQLVR